MQPPLTQCAGSAARAAWRIGLVLPAALSWGCSDMPAATDGGAAPPPAAPAAGRELLVERRSEDAPTAVFAALTREGQARWLRYDPARLRVTAAGDGASSAEASRRLMARTQEPGFQEALARRSYTGDGLATGDQFRLRLLPGAGPGQEAFGFLPDAPAALRGVVEETVALALKAPSKPLTAAYVRSLPVEPERFRLTLQEGRVRYHPLSGFPADLRRLLTGALDRPDDFLPLNGAQFRRLSERTSHGPELFITREDRGYQLTLYRGNAAPAPPRKEKAP